jgi:hypothetical protein
MFFRAPLIERYALGEKQDDIKRWLTIKFWCTVLAVKSLKP